MKLLTAIIFWVLASVAYAQDRPSDGLPNGTYKKSCHECKVANGRYLICQSCNDGHPGPLSPLINTGGKKTGVSLDLTTCPNGPVWNHNGQLECGDG